MNNKSILGSKDTKMVVETLRNIRAKENKKALEKELEILYNGKDSDPKMNVYLEIFPGNSYGCAMEKLYIKKNGLQKVSAKTDRGDFKTSHGKHAEYKFTYSPHHKAHAYNFVQIRPWQNIVGYVFEAYCDIEGFITFHISKGKMTLLLEEFGHLAHGTQKTNKNRKKEYALRGNIGDKLWHKMLEYNDPQLLF